MSGRVLLTPFGTAGDINPLIAVGRSLRTRGVDVLVAAWAPFRASVEGAGLRCETIEADVLWDWVLEEVRGDVWGRGGPRPARDRWIRRIGPRVRETLPIARAFEPDVVMGNAIALHGRVVADAVRARWVCAMLSPTNILSLDEPPQLGPRWRLPEWPRWRRRLVRLGAVALTAHRFDRPTNLARRHAGLGPRVANFYGRMGRGAASIALFSPVFRPPAADDPRHLTIAGFAWNDGSAGPARLEDRLARFLDDGEPPVLVSPGTIKAHAAPELFEAALDACRANDKRAVLVTGADADTGATDAISVAYAPYSALLPRCALSINHGGTGTFSWALRAHKPMIITPMAYDQWDHASRLERLGVALQEPVRTLTADRLAEKLDRVLGEPSFARRAGELGAAIEREDGAEVAAERIVGILNAGEDG